MLGSLLMCIWIPILNLLILLLITQKLKELGPGAMIFKTDISSAFRHIRINPGDIDLLGIHHNEEYIDTS